MTTKTLPLVHSQWVASLGVSETSAFPGVEAHSAHGQTLRVFNSNNGPLPLYAHSPTVAVIFDGLLYSRDELVTDNRPLNDAEVILQAYERLGENLLSHLKGIFALVIWDSAAQKLLFVRDPLGTYPFFYAARGEEWLVSPSIQALVDHFHPKTNRLAVAHRFLHVWVNETFYEGVERLLAGHFARWHGGALSISRYWDPCPPGQPVQWIREDAREIFDHLLDQAVSRFIDLGQSGIFLSGGIDSVSIAAAAVDMSHRSNLPLPMALSMAFPGPEADEREIQIKVAQGLGISQFMISVDEAAGPDGLVPATLKLTAELAYPLINLWFPAYERLALAGKERGCQVIITGAGGDEWLGITPSLAADYIRALNFPALFHLYRMLSRSFKVAPAWVASDVIWSSGLKLMARRWVTSTWERQAPESLYRLRYQRALRALPQGIPVDPKLHKEFQAAVRARAFTPRPTPSGSVYLDEMRWTLDHVLVSLEPEENYEMMQRIGMPILYPYWDADLVDTLCRIPPEILSKGDRSKGLVRESLARRFPDLGFDRQVKVLASDYFKKVFLEGGRKAWPTLGSPQALADLGILDSRRAQAIYDEAFSDPKIMHVHRLWDIMSLESWLRAHYSS